jgi:multidrug efflux system membrane fusion protein
MKKSYLLALFIAILAVGWIASGQFDFAGEQSSDERANEQSRSVAERQIANGDREHLTAVRTRTSVARTHVRKIVARGRTEALRRVVIKSEIKGKISALKAREGQRVSKGDLLARIEIKDRAAKLAEAKALVRQRQIEFDASAQLRKKGFRAETQYAAAEAALDAAKAAVKQVEVEIATTRIHAPFDGIIDDRAVELGDYVEGGNPMFTIIDEDPFLVVAQIPEHQVARLKPGMPASAQLVTGATIDGVVRFVAATAEPNTRTFKAELEVRNPDFTLRDGITAELHIPTESITAHLVTPAILTLDDDGRIGINSVDADNVVHFHPVTLSGNEDKYIWISGLPPELEIIVVGQEFVRAGDKVRPTREPAQPSDDARQTAERS